MLDKGKILPQVKQQLIDQITSTVSGFTAVDD